jgi:hypothetical protein
MHRAGLLSDQGAKGFFNSRFLYCKCKKGAFTGGGSAGRDGRLFTLTGIPSQYPPYIMSIEKEFHIRY